MSYLFYFFFFFFKQKTAYEMRISDWSSDVCSSDLLTIFGFEIDAAVGLLPHQPGRRRCPFEIGLDVRFLRTKILLVVERAQHGLEVVTVGGRLHRSEEHTSELQSLMRISYAVFCLKKTK